MARYASDLWRSLVLVLALALLVMPGQALAQDTTGAIVGVVTDPDQARIPGVRVTIEGPALIQERLETVTGANGTYRFPGLPPGEYRVTFMLQGFQTVRQEGVRVVPGQTYAVDVTLELGGVEEAVVVTGQAPLIDVKGADIDHTVGEEYIESLPVARRFSDLLNTMPGVSDGLYTFSPANTVYGSSVRENTYKVDGLNFVDPVVRSPVTDVPYDDIAEVRVSTAGFAAEHGEAAGGIFQFVTKSGGNTFSGTANFHFENNSLQANNIDDELAAQGLQFPTERDHVYDWGGNLGGPIVKNQLWFFQSYHRFDQEESQSDFPNPITTEQWQTLSKLTWQVDDSNNVTASYTRRDRTGIPFNFGFSTADDPRTWIGIGWVNDAAQLAWTSTLSDNTFLEVRGGFTLFDLLNLEPNLEPGTPVYFDLGTGKISGGTFGTFGTNHRDRYEVKADVSHFARTGGGEHNVKAGVSYAALRSNTFREDQSASGETFHFLNDGEPLWVRQYNLPLRQTGAVNRIALYAQDEWSVTDRMTLNLGVRADHSNGWLPESEFLGGRWREAEVFPESETLFSDWAIAPRLGITFDLTGDRRTVLRASAGQFYHLISTLEIGTASPTSVGFREFEWNDLNGDLVFQEGEEGTLRRDTTGTVVGQIDPDLKIPHTNMLSVGIDRELGRDFVVTLNGIYKDEKNMVLTTDLNIPFSAYDPVTVTNPLDGQPLTIFTLRPEFLGVPSQPFVTNPNDPITPERTYKGLELVVRKRLTDNWQGLLSYNLGRAESHQGTLFFDSGPGGGGLFTNPNNLVNAFGPTSLDRTHTIKASGTYIFPQQIAVSAHVSLLSGVPWLTSQSGGGGINGAREVRFPASENPGILTEPFIDVAGEPRGGQRHDWENQVNLRVDKNFELWNGANLSVQADVFNLFNANTVIRYQSLRIDQSNFLTPAQILFPRRARIGARLTF